ncbi:MAG TPA: alpha/beta fold hydrolase [Ktedonobacterales bacterium]|jgi:polyhydroxyalkanoate synthase
MSDDDRALPRPASRANGADGAAAGSKARPLSATAAAKDSTARSDTPGSNGPAAMAEDLAETRRRLAAAETALADERGALALAEEALERERQRADAATATLEAAQRGSAPATPPPPAPERPGTTRQGAGNGERARHAERTENARDRADTFPWPILPGMGSWPGTGDIPGAEVLAAGQRMAQAVLRNPGLALRQSTEFVDELTRIVSGQSKIAPDPKDKRFEDPAWTTNPFYKAALQTYLVWRKSLNNLVDHSNLPKKDADRARFALSLYTEALAPTNTLLGNPTAMKQLYQAGGASAVRGITHMIEDIARNGGLPSQVDMKAFEVGKNLALSKGAVVYKDDVMEVIQYAPTSATVHSRPMLSVPPQINKFYIFDLSPGKSLVEYLTRGGFTIFAISWRNPTAAQRDWGLETYMRAILKAVDVVRDITGQDTVNVSGACAGGMTLAVTLGHLAARGEAPVNAATFMVTVLDSSVESTMGLFASKETIAVAKALSKARGALEGQEMARIFAWLRPNDLIWNYWVNNYLVGKDPAAFDILYWNNDTTRLPSKFHTELLDFSLKNPLTKPGGLKLLGTPIDLSRVTLDTFITAGITDHITPWQGAYATTQLLGGQPEFVLSSAGHIQSILNPPGNPKARYFTHAEYPANPTQWLARAEQQAGTWWDRWREWLGQRSGERVPAPTALGNERYPAGAPAPGTYVFEP